MKKKPSKSEQKQQAKKKLTFQALTLYVSGGEGFDKLMDELGMFLSNKEWEELTALLEQADEWMVEGGVGSVVQTEKVLAKQEGRESRIPSILGDEEAREYAIWRVQRDLESRGIPFAKEC